MKRAMAWILTAAMLLGLMAGCGKQSPAAQTPREPGEKVMEQVSQGLAMRLSLTDEQAEDLVVTDARDYGDESIIRYSQVWQGVEIYGSSIVTTSEDETFAMGAYYDLSEAFGEDFDTLVAQAAQAPAWMTDQTAEDLAVRFDRDSLRPVIYITEDQTALVARCFIVELTSGGETYMLEVVTSPAGDRIYSINNLEEISGYDNVTVEAGDASCEIVKDNGTWYAYNEEYNFYLASEIYGKSGEVDADDYCRYQKNIMMYQGYGEEGMVYSRENDDWSKGDAKNVIRAMDQMYQVADWYYNTFGYWCIDNMGGLCAVVLCDEVKGTAQNANSAVIILSPKVVNAPEILVHEYGHAVFRYFTWDLGELKNQTAALSEAVCDVFGCLYLAEQGDKSWIVGAAADSARNISGTFKTMDDYGYDRYKDNEEVWKEQHPKYVFDMWLTDQLGESIDDAGDQFFGEGDYVRPIYAKDGSSTTRRYANSFIISNTLYRFWKEDLGKDSELLGKMLYRSLRYMPSRPDFSDFRNAFVYAAELFGGPGVAAAAGAQFDKAGIPADVAWNIVRVVKSQLNNKRLLAYCTADFAAISEAFRDSFYTTPDADGGNVWNCTCMIAQGLSIVFTFASDYEDPDATPIYATYDDLMYWSGGSTGAELAQGLNMGMTYAEAAKALDLTELEYAPEQHWTEPVFLVYGGAEDCALELYFVGTGEDNAVLVSVNAFPAG